MREITFIIKLLFSVLTTICIGDVFGKSEKEIPISYTLFPNRSQVQLFLKEPTIVFDKHNSISSEVCGSESDLYCLVGGESYFVFPKKGITINSSWSYRNQKFHVVKKVIVRLLGREIDAFLIEQIQKKDGLWYLFSPDFGLIAFGLGNKNKINAFLLNNECGFGASDACKSNAVRRNK